MEEIEKYKDAKELLYSVNPSLRSINIHDTNTFGGEFLLFCIQKIIDNKNKENHKCQCNKSKIEAIKINSVIDEGVPMCQIIIIENGQEKHKSEIIKPDKNGFIKTKYKGNEFIATPYDRDVYVKITKDEINNSKVKNNQY